MTRVRINTRSISSCFGTLPNSSCSATAILALRSFFFCSGVGISHLYRNSTHLSSIDTLILMWVLIQTARHPTQEQSGCRLGVSERFVFDTTSTPENVHKSIKGKFFGPLTYGIR